MSEYISLTKTLIASVKMDKPQDKRKKIMFALIGIFVLVFIFAPVLLGCTFLVKVMTEALIPFEMQHLAIALVFHIICLFSAVFGFNVIFNEFYFSSDLDYLRPLPLSPVQIAGAKLTVSYYLDNIMQFALVVACIVGFYMASDLRVLGMIASVFAVFTLPILPLTYCACLGMLIMAFSKFIRNREVIQKMSAFTIALAIILLALFSGYVKQNNIDIVSIFITPGGSAFVDTMNVIFPNVGLIVDALSYGNISSLILYIVINIISIAFVLFVAKLIYFKGFENITDNSYHGSKNIDKLLKNNRQRNVFIAYLLKEIRILIRTPAFFTNCIAVNFLWPALIYVILRFRNYELGIGAIQSYFKEHTPTATFALLSATIAISLIITAMNSISSNSISREGKHFSFMKYIPVPYHSQWDVKVTVSILFSIIGIWIYLIPFLIAVKVSALTFAAALLLSFLSVSFVSFLGVLMDSVQPKITWDDELGALRENTNVVFTMGISLFVAAVMCVGGYMLYGFVRLNSLIIALIYLIIISLLNLCVIFLSNSKGEKNLSDIEEAV